MDIKEEQPDDNVTLGHKTNHFFKMTVIKLGIDNVFLAHEMFCFFIPKKKTN